MTRGYPEIESQHCYDERHVQKQLNDLAVGETAHFDRAEVDHDTAGFLRAIGLTRHSEVRLCKAGEPCIIQVRSTRIGLSRPVASRIFVVPIASAQPGR